ncbi:NAD(P)H-hydrate dehydratase [Amphibacillus indicireducens]|uniref:Bifunctional NAD(P)H-hydrate repair enzyme n=1 Tax=Amphibacillus indicireducens TaxID=1076330 RepID=A0ABP7VVY0_9BACI
MRSVTAKEMYDIDRKAINDYQLSGVLLMENAGRAIAEKIQAELTKDMKAVVLIGAGNNGGDGFVIARTLLNLGFQLDVIQLVADADIKGDAAEHKAILTKFNCPIIHVDQTALCQKLIHSADIIIDAMLGIGFKGRLKEPYRSVVEEVNTLETKVVAVDIPSGVPAETTNQPITAIKADLTYCIEAPKPSAFIERYASFYGKWEIVEIGLPSRLIEASSKEVWTLEKVKQTLPRREQHSHKGSHGKGLIIGGTKTMPGAARLTANAALRSGAGLLTVATSQEALPVVASGVTEATFLDLDDEQIDLLAEIKSFDAIAIGMGMGRSDQTQLIVDTVLTSEKPVVVDADGLFYLKNRLSELKNRKAPTILTPHPGEMAMLIDQSIEQIKNNPFEIAKSFAVKHQLYLVLKGAYTIVTAPNGYQTINQTGNPALAKGGSGDCLAGIILAQVMQKGTIEASLANACYIHGLAADLAVEKDHSMIDFLATDLINFLPKAFRTCLD